jgi:superfamily II DNA or RNA helicase
MKSPGPVLIYSNFVLMEGIDILKIYLKYFGFDSFINKNSKDYFRYAEFHNSITTETRKESLKIEVDPINKHGKLIKIMLFSPAGAEGISLANIRQVHITEPYWNEVRVIQMIGRAIRQCSHKDLPKNERSVDVFLYLATRLGEETIDQYIWALAKQKNKMISEFETLLKESAVDCKLFYNRNVYPTDEYKLKCVK